MRHLKFFLLILSVFIAVSCGSGGEPTAKTDFTDGSVRAVASFSEDGISHTLGTFEDDGDGIQVTAAELNQNEPEVIYLAGQNLWLTVWEDERNAATMGTDIYGRLINADGTPCGNEFIIAATSDYQSLPRVAYKSSNDTAVITWQDSRGNAAGGYVYFKTLTINNAATCAYTLGAEKYFGFDPANNQNGVDIGTDGLTTREKPVVRYNSQNDTFYFVWIEKRALKHTIRHQCLNTPAATYTQVLADGNTYIGFAEVPAASLGNASPFAADLANTQDTTGKLTDGYTTMRISDSTNLGWSPETIEVEDFLSLQNPDIACSYLTGECTVVFEAIRRTYTMECEDNNGVIEMSWEETSLDTVSNIYAIHDSDLTGDGITEKVNTGTEFASHYPAIGFDGTTQRYLVAWERHQTSVKPKIFGQILYSGGGLYSGNFQIGFNYETVEHGQTNPNITYDSTNGRFLVTWADARTGATSLENIDVFGQFVNGAGSLSGSNFPLTTNQYNQQNPSAAYNAFSQTFISVWADARNLGTSTCGSGAQPCGSDIYAIRYALGQPQITLYGESGSILNPAQISYGTINTSATLQKSFKIRNTGDDVLRLKCFSSISAPFSYVNLPAELSACDNNYQEINPNTEQTYNVTFSPTANGTFNTSFEIVSNAGYRTIYLTGTAQQASIEIPNLTGNTLNFDNVTVGTTASQSFRIRNNGQVGYNINGVQVSAPFAFDTANSPVLPYTLNAGSEAVFYISYTPSSATAVTRTVSISTDAGISTSFSVTGRGTGSSSDNGTDDGDDDTDGGGNGESGEPKGGCSAGGSANLPIALFALAGMARIVIRRKERR